MENASKALLMAGGILIAIIIISVLMLSLSNITNMKQAEVDAELRKEVNNFNKPYLAFNKKAMYGTDVISVLNFAINNNKMYNVKFGDSYYVDINFRLTKDSIQDRVYQYVLNEETATYTSSYSTENTGYGISNQIFEVNHTYSLSANLEPITAFLLTAEQNEETKIIDETKGATVIKYRVRYSGIADFKRKTFKCSKVEYDNEGRVSALYFEQVQASTYGG